MIPTSANNYDPKAVKDQFFLNNGPHDFWETAQVKQLFASAQKRRVRQGWKEKHKVPLSVMPAIHSYTTDPSPDSRVVAIILAHTERTRAFRRHAEKGTTIKPTTRNVPVCR